MKKVFIWFVKITGFIPYLFYFKVKKYYINKNKKRKYPALLISNHTSVMDFALYLYIFHNKTIRPLAAEILYNKNKFLTFMLKMIGAIRVDRDLFDFSFIEKSIDVINKGEDVLIFPEGRIPTDKNMLEFKSSFIEIALETDAPIIPIYTNGSYGKKKRAKVFVGEEIYLSKLYDNNLSKKENVENLTNYVRNTIIDLGDKLYAIEQKEENSANM